MECQPPAFRQSKFEHILVGRGSGPCTEIDRGPVEKGEAQYMEGQGPVKGPSPPTIERMTDRHDCNIAFATLWWAVKIKACVYPYVRQCLSACHSVISQSTSQICHHNLLSLLWAMYNHTKTRFQLLCVVSKRTFSFWSKY